MLTKACGVAVLGRNQNPQAEAVEVFSIVLTVIHESRFATANENKNEHSLLPGLTLFIRVLRPNS